MIDRSVPDVVISPCPRNLVRARQRAVTPVGIEAPAMHRLLVIATLLATTRRRMFEPVANSLGIRRSFGMDRIRALTRQPYAPEVYAFKGALALLALATTVVLLAAPPAQAESRGSTVQTLRLSWEVHSAAAPLAPSAIAPRSRIDRLTVLERRSAIGPIPRQRRAEVSSGQVVVTAIDAAGMEKARSVLPDPRIIRAEIPDASGALQGIVLLRPNADFLVTVPGSQDIRELRIYEPRWNGRGFNLLLVATVRVE
jgi:hypothetical protein